MSDTSNTSESAGIPHMAQTCRLWLESAAETVDARIGVSRSAAAGPSGSPLGATGRAAGVAQHLVALQRDVELFLELGELRDLHADGGARVERNRPGEVPERPVAIRDAQAGDVEDRFALEFTARGVVEDGVLELDLVGRSGDRPEQVREEIFPQGR